MKIAVISIFLVLVVASSSLAQVGVTIGNEYGIGAVAQLGSRNAKIEFGGGFAPLLVYWQIKYYGPWGSTEDTYLKFYLPLELGAKLNFSPSDSDENRLGFKVGATYNTVMKVGFGGGMEIRLGSKSPYITLSAGAMYYPEAYDELLKRLNESEGTNFTTEDVSAAMVNFRPYLALTIYFGG